MARLTMLHEGPGESYGIAAPIALIVADDAKAMREAVTALELAGCIARKPVSFAEASADLSNYDGLDLILIEVVAAPDALLDVVLARADTLARERSLGIVDPGQPGEGLRDPRDFLAQSPQPRRFRLAIDVVHHAACAPLRSGDGADPVGLPRVAEQLRPRPQ